MSSLLLARIQFGMCISFHYLFVPISIGLSGFLAILEGMYLYTKKKVYNDLVHFFVRIFAVIFVFGVVSGLVQAFAFGTNWSKFSIFSGRIFGPLLCGEGIFAFFLESIFLSILIFGWKKVSSLMHFFSTCMVALGTHLSAFWIVTANSWMQTPAGHKLINHNGCMSAELVSCKDVVFCPSNINRIIHVLLGCWIAGAFFLISVSALFLLQKRHVLFAKMGLKIGIIAASILLLLQLGSGDASARALAKYQPVKMASFEGVFKTEERTPIWLFGFVDTKNERVIGLPLPGALSFLIHRNINTPVDGLESVSKNMRPNVQVVFQLYHMMIYAWSFMVLLTLFGWVFLKKKYNYNKFMLRMLSSGAFVAVGANIIGWCATEIGRQPWSVQNILQVKDSVTITVGNRLLFLSMSMFILIFLVLGTLFIVLIKNKIKEGPAKD